MLNCQKEKKPDGKEVSSESINCVAMGWETRYTNLKTEAHSPASPQLPHKLKNSYFRHGEKVTQTQAFALTFLPPSSSHFRAVG